jgi:hypothetical protein
MDGFFVFPVVLWDIPMIKPSLAVAKAGFTVARAVRAVVKAVHAVATAAFALVKTRAAFVKKTAQKSPQETGVLRRSRNFAFREGRGALPYFPLLLHIGIRYFAPVPHRDKPAVTVSDAKDTGAVEYAVNRRPGYAVRGICHSAFMRYRDKLTAA